MMPPRLQKPWKLLIIGRPESRSISAACEFSSTSRNPAHRPPSRKAAASSTNDGARPGATSATHIASVPALTHQRAPRASTNRDTTAPDTAPTAYATKTSPTCPSVRCRLFRSESRYDRAGYRAHRVRDKDQPDLPVREVQAL